MRWRDLSLRSRFFRVSVLAKCTDGMVEVVGGILLLIVSPAAITHLATIVTAHELAQDPDDLVATRLLGAAGSLTAGVSLFAAIYLIGHGVVKVGLAWAVLTDRLWAFPGMLLFLSGFIAYQSYRMVVAPTWGLAALTAFDAVIVWLTALEWRAHRRARREAAAAALAPRENVSATSR